MINPIKYLKNIKFKMPSREEIANLAKAAIAIIISNKETFKKIYDYLKDFLPSNDKVKKELEKLQADYKKLEALNLEQQKIIEIQRYQNKLIIIIASIVIALLGLYIFLR